MDIGVLKRLNARELWPHEARNFSVWLSDPTRLEDLGNALKLTLSFVGREVPVGRFSVDLLAHDVDRDRPVVIENQLGPTDHDHLGKIITYSAGLDAGVVIWISPDFCEEHRAAIDWLNNHTDEDIQFFGVTLEVLQIDDSRPAVNFKVLAFPNGWQKAVAAGYGDSRRGDNPQYFQFFEQMLADLREHGWPSRMRTSSRNYQIIERTFGNIQYSVAFSRRMITAECVIENDAEFNKRLFRLLNAEAADIQSKLPSSVTWDYQDEGRKRQALYLSCELDRDDPEALDNARRWAVKHVLALKAVIQPRLQELVPRLQRDIAAADSVLTAP